MVKGTGIYKTKIRTDKAVDLPSHVLTGIGAEPGETMYMTLFENHIIMSAETAQCQICGNDTSILPMLYNDHRICYRCNGMAVYRYIRGQQKAAAEK